MTDLPRRTIGGATYTRREMLRLGATAVAGTALLQACRQEITSPGLPSVPSLLAGETLVEPARIASVGGLLETTLSTAAAPLSLGGKALVPGAYSYNGAIPGPTLVVKAGDTLRVHLRNTLTVPTNLHFNGLHVSPTNKGDNPFTVVDPGVTFDYEVKIPANHPGGVYTYFACVPGSSYEQISRGLSGMIVIESGHDQIDTFTAMRKRTLGLSAIYQSTIGTVITPSLAADPVTGVAPIGFPTNFVNGQLLPTITMHPGEAQYWRLANLSADAYYVLRLDGCQMLVIAEDGHPLTSPLSRAQLEMTPGKRYEVVVTAPASGVYDFRTLGYGLTASERFQACSLASVLVSGETVRTLSVPAAIAPIKDLSTANPARYRFATVATDTLTGGITIGCNSCNAASTAVQPKLGTVEEWTVTNSTTVDHVFRMNTFPVQVTKSNGTSVTALSYTDTIKIPTQNSVTFRVSFDDFLGKTVYGSAIASQRDLGAYSTIEVVA
jgi:FtsP/CotA-like multicopper oxidase with cupredoxin domain